MTHDPFDRLRNANPVPGESLPSAPMATAERIMRGGSASPTRWPGWAVATAAAVAVLAVGGGWMLWLGRDGRETAAADPTTSIAATVTTEAAVTPTTQVTVFMLDQTDTGAVVVPVPRTVGAAPGAESALAELLSGLSDEESMRDLTTAIPDGIDGPPLQIVERVAGIVTVWVPQTWVDFGYPTPEGIAQIVFTLTSIDGIDGVGFVLGEERVPGGAVSGSGFLVPESQFADYPFVDHPVTRLTYEGYMPLAFVESPAFGAELTLPIEAHGVVNSIGNQVRLTLEVDEMTLWQETVTATCGTAWSECRGEWDWSTWQVTIPDVGFTGGANLIAEAFGSGVEIIDRRTYPLTIVAAGGTPPTETTATTVVEAGPAVPGELAVYMLMDSDSTFFVPGPYLAPAAWTTAILSAPLTDPARQAMQWLVQGPLPGWSESIPALSTAIPQGTRLLDLTVADRIASVDLSSEFVSGGGSFSMRARLAQVVFTLTRFDDIDGVRFLIDGVPTTVFGGEGVIVDDPATRDGFDDLLPAVMIETPMYWGTETANPLVVSGTANVFEATVSLALTDKDGLILWEGFTTATCGTGCRGDWSIEIPYSVASDQLGSVIAWESSAEDGRQTNVREHPVWLRGSEVAGCSGTRVPDGLSEQAGLPEAAAVTRDALFEAARTCDWEALAALVGPNTNTTFGGPIDPIEQWKQEEAAGLEPMYWLAATLQLPAVQETLELVNGPWIWPSAAAYYWEQVPEADLQALLTLYDEDDLAGFDDFGGFYGHRIGIAPDGEWTYFVAGD